MSVGRWGMIIDKSVAFSRLHRSSTSWESSSISHQGRWMDSSSRHNYRRSLSGSFWEVSVSQYRNITQLHLSPSDYLYSLKRTDFQRSILKAPAFKATRPAKRCWVAHTVGGSQSTAVSPAPPDPSVLTPPRLHGPVIRTLALQSWLPSEGCQGPPREAHEESWPHHSTPAWGSDQRTGRQRWSISFLWTSVSSTGIWGG